MATINTFVNVAVAKINSQEFLISYIDETNQIGYALTLNDMKALELYALSPGEFNDGKFKPSRYPIVTISPGIISGSSVIYVVRDKRGFGVTARGAMTALRLDADVEIDNIKFNNFEELGIVLNRFYQMMESNTGGN